MTKIVLFSRKYDSNKSKIDWLIAEIKKRDLEIMVPDMSEEWDKDFREIRRELSADTIVIAKGDFAMNMLRELEKGQIGLKNLLIITDETNKTDILNFNFDKIKKKALQFFVYAFNNNINYKIEEAIKLAEALDTELSILENPDDNSEYEDILIDILSLQD